MSIDPRREALSLLCRLDTSGALLDPLLEAHHATIISIPPRDRALFHALVLGVTRWRKRLDFLIHQLARSPKKEISPPLRNVLRMGLFQLIYLDRIPDAAIVHTSVTLAKGVGAPWAAGFVNGVLRTAARQKNRLPLPSPTLSLDRRLAVTHAFPRWLVSRWLSRFGPLRTENLCKACNAIPPMTIRTNTLRCTRPSLAASLNAISDSVHPTVFAPDGLHLHRPRGEVESWPGYDQGWFQVQDEAAQLVCDLLAPGPGDMVLDTCAGLGGKTGAMAAMMGDHGNIVAMDCSRGKLIRLNREMARLGASRVIACCSDATTPLPFAGRLFGRILVDAPCTGLGVIRRNPDTKWRRRPDDLDRHAQRQYHLLTHAAEHVSPKGRMVYTVCSMEPEETTMVVNRFLSAHPDFVLTPASVTAPPGRAPLVDAQGFFMTYPDVHDMDGFFAAVMEYRP